MKILSLYCLAAFAMVCWSGKTASAQGSYCSCPNRNDNRTTSALSYQPLMARPQQQAAPVRFAMGDGCLQSTCAPIPERTWNAAASCPSDYFLPDSCNFDGPMPPACSCEMDTTGIRWATTLEYQVQIVRSDYQHFYSPKRIHHLGIGLLLAGVAANSEFDENFTDVILDAMGTNLTEDLAELRCLGDGDYVIPILASAALVSPFIDELPGGQRIGEWGQRGTRIFLVGGPVSLFLQRLTGASRPGENDHDSAWRPFQDNNGLSGHAFVGAVPFLAAAEMTDNRLYKSAFYVGSTLPALSRIADRGHYASQAFLGWYLAFLASKAVSETQWSQRGLEVHPFANESGTGLMVGRRF